MEDMWKTVWEDSSVKNRHIISDPTKTVPGFDFSRAMWTTLNRITFGTE